ncbi:Probable RNA-directed DNA polymerase from transposon X-element [Eumeta japonica]|uniref:Probable RNA-directed DNA polymerase from transposon X-element n=1 Tax=Eumeta variegata TaxID=151549 RepID=A0A4C1Z6R3_EUMVA|nr:Probable RNA-directed DNA polymerase from transposon X-element [Eumeta japonica]
MRLGSLIGDCPPPRKIITSWKKVSAALEETDTPLLNNIPDDIVSTDDIDNAIGALISHITTVVENSSRKVPAKSDRRELPRNVRELIRDKNAALCRAGKYSTCENRSRARGLQRKVKARMKEVRNDNWSDLMAEISPSHKAYWGLAKALKTEGDVPTPAMKPSDNSIAFDDREKSECLAESIEHQCSENPPYDVGHVRRVEQEIGTAISSKALKCFSAPLVALLVAIFNACIQNCYFPTAWKEAVVIDISKPGKPRDRPASYRPISLLSVLVRPIRAEIPQGSTLSPLLYFAFLNDIPRPSSGVQLALFADDTALFLHSNCLRNILPRLQRAIDELTQWIRLWRIKFSPCERDGEGGEKTHYGPSMRPGTQPVGFDVFVESGRQHSDADGARLPYGCLVVSTSA